MKEKWRKRSQHVSGWTQKHWDYWPMMPKNLAGSHSRKFWFLMDSTEVLAESQQNMEIKEPGSITMVIFVFDNVVFFWIITYAGGLWSPISNFLQWVAP